MKKIKAFIAVFLVLTVFMGTVPLKPGAETLVELPTNAVLTTDTENQSTENTYAEQPTNTPAISEFFVLPDIIDSAEAEEKGYIGRITEDEPDLNTFIFKNADGTNTLRLFDHPVKYVDKYGVIRDISLKLKKKDNGSFVSTEHIVNTVFSRNLSDGIELEYNDVSVKLTPQTATNTSDTLTTTVMPIASVSNDKKSVTYSVDENTSYEYQLTYAGFKEDIVVSEYTGQTEYNFILQTNGLTLTKIQESYFLTDKNGEIKATIGDIIVFTANERNNTMGSMTHRTLKADQLYAMTIHLDAEYLADENTMYPIRIDPTIEVKYTSSADAGAIEDVTINSQDTSAGASGSLYVGLRNTYGISRVLMRFPRLDLSVIPNANNITNAYVKVRDLLCPNTPTIVQCFLFTGNLWSESNVDWSTVSPNSYGVQMAANSVYYDYGITLQNPHTYTFNITPAVKGWKTNTYSQSKGVIFKSYEENITKNATFASFNRATNKPSLTVEYSREIQVSSKRLTLRVGETASVTVTDTNPNNYTVKWSSSNSRVAQVNEANGLITAKACGQIFITVKYEEDPTLFTDIVLFVVANGTETPGIDTDSVYMIKNSVTGKHLYTNDSGVISTSNGTDMDGRYLWYVTRSGTGYKLCSMGYKGSDYGASEYLLTGCTTNSTPTLTADGGSRQIWNIDKATNSNHYYLTNATSGFSGTILTANLSHNVNMVSLGAETDCSKWIFEEINTADFNNYWSGTHLKGIDSNGVVHFEIILDNSVHMYDIIQREHFDVVDIWNEKSDKFIIYGPDDPIPPDIDPFVITMKGETSSNRSVAKTRGLDENGNRFENGNTLNDPSRNYDWYGAEITFYFHNDSRLIDENIGDDDIEQIILHELGHVLKLSHTSEANNEARAPYGTCPDDIYDKVVSIMNVALPKSSGNLASMTPKWHDIINLKNKWG